MGFEQIMIEVLKTLSFEFIFLIAAGVLIGLVIGALPGLTTTMGIALLTGITFKFSGHSAIALLLGLYVGGVSGGSLSAILIGIPGTPANASSVQDGFPLAMAGKGAQAITISRAASVMGTVFGIVCLAFFDAAPDRTRIEVHIRRILPDRALRRPDLGHPVGCGPRHQGLGRRHLRTGHRHGRQRRTHRLAADDLRQPGAFRRHPVHPHHDRVFRHSPGGRVHDR